MLIMFPLTVNPQNRSKVVYGALLVCSLVWLGLIFAAPCLMVRRNAMASMMIYQGFSVICHQIPERSFLIGGFPLGVCSRCTGIYAGFLLGLFFYPIVRNLSAAAFPERRWLIVAALPLSIDFAGGLIGVFNNNLFSRTATGLLFGTVLAFYILPGLQYRTDNEVSTIKGGYTL
jgi:uncharacterized membrane protein